MANYDGPLQSFPSYNAPPSSGNYYGPPSLPLELYPGFVSDLKLLFKLGHVALIAFLILAVILILFLIVFSCIYCLSMRRKGEQQPPYRFRDAGGFGPHDVFPEPAAPAVKPTSARPGPIRSYTQDSPRPLIRHSNNEELNNLSDSTDISNKNNELNKLSTGQNAGKRSSSDSSAERERSMPYYELPPTAIPVVPRPIGNNNANFGTISRQNRSRSFSRQNNNDFGNNSRDEVDLVNNDGTWVATRSRLV